MKFDLTPTMQNIVRELNKIGKYCWVVGGAVRDQLLNQPPKDIDFATNYNHLDLEVLLNRMDLIVIPDNIAKQHGIIRVVDKDTGEIIDIARLRKDCSTDGRHAIVEFTDILEEDLARRDFTINAMAVQINSDGEEINFIDLFEGQKHIQEHTIKWVGEADTRIKEDYLRLVRMCRFTSLWEFCTYELHAYHQYRDGLSKISKERIRDEILKAISYPKPSNFFRSLHACGLLNTIMPELGACFGVDQNEYHAEDVWQHLMRTGDASVELTDKKLLRLACFFHDVGKTATKSTDKDGRIHFYNHEVHGAWVVRNWMKEYKFSTDDIEYVYKIIRHHQWRFDDDTKEKTIKRWLITVGTEDWRDLITVRCADRKGNLARAHKPMITQKMRELMKKAQDILDRKDPLSRKDLAINGHDLIELGLKPGFAFKQILDELVEKVVDDPIFNQRDKLLEYVEKNYGS